MEITFKPIRPIDVFITNIDAGVLKWRANDVQVQKNKPSGNELIDNLAELLSIYQMSTTAFYEKELGLKKGALHPIILLHSGISFREWRDQYIMLSAKDWLAETDYKLDIIGKRMGFSGIYTFSKWFIRKEKYGPIHWRKSAKRRRSRQEQEQFLQWKRERYKEDMANEEL